MRITFVGDVCFDGNPGHTVTTASDPFAAVASVLKDTDLAIANLECAVATAGEKGTNRYSFKAPTECVPVLKRYFSAVSLANNHSGDWGKEGFASELDLLEREKLPYFGGGRNLEQARRPLILALARPADRALGLLRFPAPPLCGRPQHARHGLADRRRRAGRHPRRAGRATGPTR